MEKGLNIFYDEEADVLYFTKGKPNEDVVSNEIGDDIIVRINPIANVNKQEHIKIINDRIGISTPQIITPLQIFLEKEDE